MEDVSATNLILIIAWAVAVLFVVFAIYATTQILSAAEWFSRDD